jgi:hypothetical protein
MRAEDFGAILSNRLASADILVPERSLLFPVAADIRKMSGAYRSDGEEFGKNGDPVNALASFAYGLGWLDAGCGLGLLKSGGTDCEFGNWDVPALPEYPVRQLEEKTSRYELLLNKALGAVEPASEKESPLFPVACRIHLVTSLYARQGNLRFRQGVLPSALALFSYGHGWLDAGVRSGLFRITSHREIFAI